MQVGEILIKAVAQATPTYTMSCFKIPNSLCNELNSMISNFWWGQKDRERKMAWVSWKKLCTPKERGGMGFRDLKAFNLALLAKQGWQMQKNQTSLIYRVFKAKYFAQCSFMEAQLGRRPSYVWQSIMAAREIVERGSKWSIGNGEQVRIWKDCWLPTPSSFKVVSQRPPHADSELVASLIDMERRGWDVSKVRNTFMPQEAQAILGIPISPRLPQDSLLWAWTPSGKFTVNSAYKVAQLLLREADQKLEWEEKSNNSGMQSLWKLIWNLNCPHKIKHFMWRACLNILPTKYQLRRRGIGRDDNCELCVAAVKRRDMLCGGVNWQGKYGEI